MEISDADCEGVRRVCEAVSTRAARLAGAGVVALVEKIGKISSCTVAVDGSLYKKHPQFSQRYVSCSRSASTIVMPPLFSAEWEML